MFSRSLPLSPALHLYMLLQFSVPIHTESPLVTKGPIDMSSFLLNYRTMHRSIEIMTPPVSQSTTTSAAAVRFLLFVCFACLFVCLFVYLPLSVGLSSAFWRSFVCQSPYLISRTLSQTSQTKSERAEHSARPAVHPLPLSSPSKLRHHRPIFLAFLYFLWPVSPSNHFSRMFFFLPCCFALPYHTTYMHKKKSSSSIHPSVPDGLFYIHHRSRIACSPLSTVLSCPHVSCLHHKRSSHATGSSTPCQQYSGFLVEEENSPRDYHFHTTTEGRATPSTSSSLSLSLSSSSIHTSPRYSRASSNGSDKTTMAAVAPASVQQTLLDGHISAIGQWLSSQQQQHQH